MNAWELNLSEINQEAAAFKEQLRKRSGANLAECCQCGKCTAACPFAPYMDVMPRQIVRYVQLAQLEAALTAKTPWICASCYTCSCRCPQEINLPALMECLRQEATRQGKIAVKEVDLFARTFMKTVRAFGRSHEMLMMGLFNIRSLHFFQDLRYAPTLYLKGKIHLLPQRIKDRATLRRLIEQSTSQVKKGGEKA